MTLDMILTSLEADRPTHEPAHGHHLEGGDDMAVIRDVMPAFELFQPASVTMRWRCSIATAPTRG